MRVPIQYKLKNLITYVTAGNITTEINGTWVPLRPSGAYSIFSIAHRCKTAWLVFTGQVDVITWEDQ